MIQNFPLTIFIHYSDLLSQNRSTQQKWWCVQSHSARLSDKAFGAWHGCFHGCYSVKPKRSRWAARGASDHRPGQTTMSLKQSRPPDDLPRSRALTREASCANDLTFAYATDETTNKKQKINSRSFSKMGGGLGNWIFVCLEAEVRRGKGVSVMIRSVHWSPKPPRQSALRSSVHARLRKTSPPAHCLPKFTTWTWHSHLFLDALLLRGKQVFKSPIAPWEPVAPKAEWASSYSGDFNGQRISGIG